MNSVLSAHADFESGDLFFDDADVQAQVKTAEGKNAAEKAQAKSRPRAKAQTNPNPKPARPRVGDSAPKPPSQSAAMPKGSRKSDLGYQQEDDSVEGLRKKYESTSQRIQGRPYRMLLANGEKLPGHWYLVDAFSITPSHNVNDKVATPKGMGFGKSRGFPTVGGGNNANSRDYERDPFSARQVVEMANNFTGRAVGVDNPIVVTQDGVVLSGNNRAMSSMLAAKQGSDTDYIETLLERAYMFGFTEDQVMEFEHPRVVFQVESSSYTSADFHKFNQMDTKAESTTQRTARLAQTLTPAVLDDMYQALRNTTYAGARHDHAGSQLIDILEKHKIITPQDRAAFVKEDGKIEPAGKGLIDDLLLGAVLEPDTIHQLDRHGRLKEKVRKNSVSLLKMSQQGSLSALSEVNKAIKNAVAFEEYAAKNKVPGSGTTAVRRELFTAFLQSGNLFEERDPLTDKLTYLLLFGSVEEVGLLLEAVDETVATQAKEEVAGDALFGDDPTVVRPRNVLFEEAMAKFNDPSFAKRHMGEVEVEDKSVQSSVRNVWYLPSRGGYVVTSGKASDAPVAFGGKTLFSSKMELSKAVAPHWLELDGSSLIKSAFIASADIKAKVTKWVGGNPDRRAAWQKAIQEYRETWGKNPQTEKDAKLILKVAHKIYKKGSFDDSMFGEARQEVEQGIPTADSSVADIPETPQPEPQASGQAQERIQNIADQDPIALFRVIQGWLTEGRFTKDQVAAAFKYVFSQAGQSQQAFSSWCKLSQKDFSFLGSHGPVSPAYLAQSWGEVHAFLSSMIHRGVTDGKYLTSSLSGYFGNDVRGVIPAYSAYTGRKPWVFCRYQPLPQSIRSKYEIMVGSKVIFSGVEGTVKKILSNGLLEVERPASIPEEGFITDTAHSSEVVLSRGEQLDFDFEAEGPGGDPSLYTRDPSAPVSEPPVKNKGGRPRKQRPNYANNIIDILQAVPSFTKAPTSLDDRRLNYEFVPAIKTAGETVPPHAAFWYTEKMPDGNNYTVEFHVDPEPDASGSHYCAVYVLNDSLGPQDSVIAQFDIEDLADWNLGEADKIDSALVKAQAGDEVDVALAQAAERLPQHVLASADFNRFWGNLNGYITCSGKVPKGDGEVLRATVYALLSGSGEPLWKQIVEAQKAKQGTGLPNIPPADVAKLPAGTWQRWGEEFKAGTIDSREVYATAKESGIGPNVSMRIANWANGLSGVGDRADLDDWGSSDPPSPPTATPAKGSQLDLFNSAKRSSFALG